MQSTQSPLTAPARLDRLGIGIGLLCAVHCLVTPLLLVALPAVVLPLAESPLVEWGLIAVSLLLGIVAIGRLGLRSHRRIHPLLLFSGGALLLVGSRFVPDALAQFEVALVVAGAIMVVGAHVRNLLCTRACSACASGPAC